MEDLYFGLFLLVIAAIFLVVWSKTRVGKKHEKSFKVRPTGRLIDNNDLANRKHLAAPPRLNTIAAVDAHRSDQMWRTRRQRATEQKGKRSDESEGIIYASYAGGEEGGSDRRIQDQDISKTEHMSIGEYLAKQDQDAAAAEAEREDGLTMTAMKYESQDSDAEEGEQALKKSGTKD